MDCFYAAIHVRDDPTLAGKPVLVGGSPEGRGVVAAASYEARRYGVRSATPSITAKRLCPHAVFLTPDFPRYRSESEKIFAILRSVSPVVQPVSIDEAYVDVTDVYAGWGSAMALAEELRVRVREQRGLTMSVGVGPNKLVAKIASDHRKPDGLTVVHPSRVEAFLAPLSVRVLPGVGPATQEHLERLGIRRVADLRSWSEDDLRERLGRFGPTLGRYALGIDDRPVGSRRGRKSLSSERTYAEDLESLTEMRIELRRLAERVGGGLQSRTLAARTVSLKVRYSDYSTVTRAMTLTEPTDSPDVLLDCAVGLLERTEAGSRPVRLLGLGVKGLAEEEEASGLPDEAEEEQLALGWSPADARGQRLRQRSMSRR
jgi:DNA polymerase-4